MRSSVFIRLFILSAVESGYWYFFEPDCWDCRNKAQLRLAAVGCAHVTMHTAVRVHVEGGMPSRLVPVRFLGPGTVSPMCPSHLLVMTCKFSSKFQHACKNRLQTKSVRGNRPTTAASAALPSVLLLLEPRLTNCCSNMPPNHPQRSAIARASCQPSRTFSPTTSPSLRWRSLDGGVRTSASF